MCGCVSFISSRSFVIDRIDSWSTRVSARFVGAPTAAHARARARWLGSSHCSASCSAIATAPNWRSSAIDRSIDRRAFADRFAPQRDFIRRSTARKGRRRRPNRRRQVVAGCGALSLGGALRWPGTRARPPAPRIAASRASRAVARAQILLDDVDLATLALRDVRLALACVPQAMPPLTTQKKRFQTQSTRTGRRLVCGLCQRQSRSSSRALVRRRLSSRRVTTQLFSQTCHLFVSLVSLGHQ